MNVVIGIDHQKPDDAKEAGRMLVDVHIVMQEHRVERAAVIGDDDRCSVGRKRTADIRPQPITDSRIKPYAEIQKVDKPTPVHTTSFAKNDRHPQAE